LYNQLVMLGAPGGSGAAGQLGLHGDVEVGLVQLGLGALRHLVGAEGHEEIAQEARVDRVAEGKPLLQRGPSLGCPSPGRWGPAQDRLSLREERQVQIVVVERHAGRDQIDRVHPFLGLPPRDGKLTTLNAGAYDELLPETREQLNEYFAPHNRRLYELVGTDFGWPA